jgi:hypothetical protein
MNFSLSFWNRVKRFDRGSQTRRSGSKRSSTFLGTFRPHLAVNLARDSPSSVVKSWTVKSTPQARVETMLDEWWASHLHRLFTRFAFVNVGNSHNSISTRVFFKFWFVRFLTLHIQTIKKIRMDNKRKLLSCPDSVIWDSKMSLRCFNHTLERMVREMIMKQL